MIIRRGKVYIKKEDIEQLKKSERYILKRYEAVIKALLNKDNRQKIAETYNVSKRTIQRWIKRYKESGVEGLKKISTRPHNSPNKCPDDIEEVVVEIRDKTRLSGDQITKLVNKSLSIEGRKERISGRTGHNILIRKGVVKYEKRIKKEWRFFEWGRPKQLMQTDITRLDGIPLLTSLDDHARKLWVEILANETDVEVIRGLCLLPGFENLLSDNGSQFSRQAELIRKYCEMRGVNHIWASIRHPQTLGKLSVAQKSLKRFLKKVGYTSLQDLRRKINVYLLYKNNAVVNSRTKCVPEERYSGKVDKSWYNQFVRTFKLEHVLNLDKQG